MHRTYNIAIFWYNSGDGVCFIYACRSVCVRVYVCVCVLVSACMRVEVCKCQPARGPIMTISIYTVHTFTSTYTHTSDTPTHTPSRICEKPRDEFGFILEKALLMMLTMMFFYFTVGVRAHFGGCSHVLTSTSVYRKKS